MAELHPAVKGLSKLHIRTAWLAKVAIVEGEDVCVCVRRREGENGGMRG